MKLEITTAGIEVTTEGIEDRKELVDATSRSYKGDVVAMAAAITGEDYTHVEKNGKESKWCECQAVVIEAFIDPFIKQVRDATGDKEWMAPGQEYMLDITELCGDETKFRGYRGIITKIELHCGALYIEGYKEGHETRNNTAEEQAVKGFSRYCNKLFGVEWSPQEHIQQGGMMYHNPQYATGRSAVLPFGEFVNEKGWGSYGAQHGEKAKHWFSRWLFAQWEANDATEGQKAILAAYNTLHGETIAKYNSAGWWKEYQGMHCASTEATSKLGKPCNWSSHEGEPDARYITLERFRKA